MTNEERDIITRFIERMGGAAAGSGFGSVPSSAPALPPIDKEADALIGELFQKYPEARYRLTQTAFVQEQALVAAQNRIKRLEWDVQQAQQQVQAAQQQAQQNPRGAGGFFSGLFGGGNQPRPGASPVWNQGQPGQPQGYPPQSYPQQPGMQAGMQPPPPQYAPGYQPGMLQRQGGSGFLGSALTTAAGVAGGLVVGNALMGMFNHGGAAASALPTESPWGGAGAEPLPEPPAAPDQYVDQGGWSTPPDNSFAQNDPGAADNSGWDGGQADQASWSDPGGDAGWDDTNT